MKPAIWTAAYVELPLHHALQTLCSFGWRYFEVSTEHLEIIENHANLDLEIEKAVRFCAENELEIPQAHAHLRANVADINEAQRREDMSRIESHIDIAAKLGVSHVVIHPGYYVDNSGNVDSVHTSALNIEAFRNLGDYAAELGARICLENMMRPGASTAEEMLELLSAIDHPAVALCLDTSHAHAAGLDLPHMIRQFGQKLVATHISDNDGTGDQHRTPGVGSISWNEVMEAFHDIGYEGLLNLEIPGERHPVRELRDLKVQFAYGVAHWLVEPEEISRHIVVKPFEWDDWAALSQLRGVQLAEHGITMDSYEIESIAPQLPEYVDRSCPEWDTDWIGVVYLSGRGGFWLARYDDLAIGQVGARDLGGVVELMRMFVVKEYRHRGVGTCLVNALIRHCRTNGIKAIEVWTAFDGLGQHLYRKCGFHVVPDRGPEFEEAMVRDEMRLRLDL